MCKQFHDHLGNKNRDDEYVEEALSDESESTFSLNLSACQEGGDDHGMDANTFSAIELNPTELAPIIDRFRYSFFIYVHGKKIKYHNLYTRLARLLSPFGPYQLNDLGLGFFLLNVSELSDYSMVLSKHPFSIPNYCVTLLNWVPNFKPSETNMKHVDVWIKLPELPIEYYDFLSRIAVCIGIRLLKIDPNTEKRKTCKFARFCVTLDLNRPLHDHIKIGVKLQAIVYEGLDLDMVCSMCRRYGHLQKNCPCYSSSNYSSTGCAQLSEPQSNLQQNDELKSPKANVSVSLHFLPMFCYKMLFNIRTCILFLCNYIFIILSNITCAIFSNKSYAHIKGNYNFPP